MLSRLLSEKTPKIEEIVFNSELELSEEHKQAMTDALNGDIEPHLIRTGRSSHLILPELGLEPISYKGVGSSCLKLKGTGNVVQRGDSLELDRKNRGMYIGPQRGNVLHMTMHTAVDNEGRFSSILGRPRSSGRLEFSSAENEYKITNDAFGSASVSIPVAYGSFDIKIEGESMGFVVLGSRDSLDRRLGEMWYIEDINKKLEGGLQIRLPDYFIQHYGTKKLKPFNMSRFLDRLRFDQGRNLRAFHDAGFARHAGHNGNYQIGEKTRKSVLLDLDSSVRLADIDAEAVFLTRTLDLISGLRGIHGDWCGTPISLLYRGTTKTPYLPFLNGYLTNLSQNKHRGEFNRVSKFLYETYTEPFIGKEEIFSEVRNSFTVAAILSIYDLMTKSLDVSPPYDREVLKHQLRDYVQRTESEFRVVFGSSEPVFHHGLLKKTL